MRAHGRAMPIAWMTVAKVNLKDHMRAYEETLWCARRPVGYLMGVIGVIPFCSRTVANPRSDSFAFWTVSVGTGLFVARAMGACSGSS